ncbi:MAG: hypothetical protein ACYC7D_10425 [Nitrososphaerales archaeon]
MTDAQATLTGEVFVLKKPKTRFEDQAAFLYTLEYWGSREGQKRVKVQVRILTDRKHTELGLGKIGKRALCNSSFVERDMRPKKESDKTAESITDSERN